MTGNGCDPPGIICMPTPVIPICDILLSISDMLLIGSTLMSYPLGVIWKVRNALLLSIAWFANV